MSLLSSIKRPGPSGFGFASTATEVTQGLDLTGKHYLITGCNSGLGLETMRVLALRGATIIATARSVETATKAMNQVGAAGTPVACDLAEPSSVRACVATLEGLNTPIDGLIANAGIMALPNLEIIHGYEAQFFTNHIGHFMLITGLLDQLTTHGRIVITSSSAHKGAPKPGIEFDNLDGAQGYSAWKAYGQSKLANLLFARHLATLLPDGQTANALHPGVINTNLGRHMPGAMTVALKALGWIGLKSIPQGAATQTYLATHPSLAGVSGEFFIDCNIAASSERGRDRALAETLWRESEAIVEKFAD